MVVVNLSGSGAINEWRGSVFVPFTGFYDVQFVGRAEVGCGDSDRDQRDAGGGGSGSVDVGRFAGGRAVVVRIPVYCVAVNVAHSWQQATLFWSAGRRMIIFG